MFYVTLLNEKGVKFEKQFKEYYHWKKFLNKVKYSKKLTIISQWKD